MKQEMKEMLEMSYKGNEVIEYIENLEGIIESAVEDDCSSIIDDSCGNYDNCEDCKKAFFKRLEENRLLYY